MTLLAKVTPRHKRNLEEQKIKLVLGALNPWPWKMDNKVIRHNKSEDASLKAFLIKNK